MQPLPLTTVRPFHIKEIALRDYEEYYDLRNEQADGFPRRSRSKG